MNEPRTEAVAALREANLEAEGAGRIGPYSRAEGILDYLIEHPGLAARVTNALRSESDPHTQPKTLAAYRAHLREKVGGLPKTYEDGLRIGPDGMRALVLALIDEGSPR